MADILIFGMKMPTDEPLRLVLNPNGQLFIDHGVTFTEYEAIELPEHGDLVDADELRAVAYKRGKEYQCVAFVDPLDITLAPVIIPASKEETE